MSLASRSTSAACSVDLGSPSSPDLSPIEPGETEPLIHTDGPVVITKAQAYSLYTSHLLSTWNIRTYEFAAIIFTQAAYPNTLRPAAIRGIVRTLASICFTSFVGRWVDQSPDRLKTLTTTISINRISVILASVLWFFIVSPAPASQATVMSNLPHLPDFLNRSELPKAFLFAFILLLGILEILSGQGNMLSMERDWVPTVAAPLGQHYDLTHLNAVTKRIDLICKLIAPIVISVAISALGNRWGVVLVGGMSACSWGIEIWCAKWVWTGNPKLQQQIILPSRHARQETDQHRGVFSNLRAGVATYFSDFRHYFTTRVWIPSFSLAMLYFSALAYSANFITFMINSGISLEIITIARALGSLIEISSTVVTPVGVRVLGRAVNHGRFRGRERVGSRAALMRDLDDNDADDGITGESVVTDDEKWRVEIGCERLGLWGIVWQFVNLIPVVTILWYMSPTSPTLVSRVLTPALSFQTLALFTFLSLSRLGLWIYDLTTQQLTQTLIPASSRSSFTSIEYSISNLFELLQNVAAIIFATPKEFKFLAVGSLVSVGAATVAYAGWVWWIRGHLVHWERMGGCGPCGKKEGGNGRCREIVTGPRE